jgi:hypothetical protein
LTAQALDIRDTAGLMSRLDGAPDERQRHYPGTEAQGLALAGSTPVEAPSDSARALLAGIVARLPGRGPKMLQFLSFEPAPPNDVGREFCVAAACDLGDVLQVGLGGHGLDARTEGIFPDAAVARLYHRRLHLCPLEVLRRGRAALLTAIDAGDDIFEMVVFESRYTEDGLGNTILASAFTGTVLVAQAGMTPLPQLARAAAAVQQAGGLLLGAVLTDCPQRPAWLRRLCVR